MCEWRFCQPRAGKGNISFANGDHYVGDWGNDKQNGKGKFGTNGHRCVRDYIDGKLTGKGTCFYANGGRYVGEFVAGNRQEYGTMNASDTIVNQGQWDNGKSVGPAMEGYRS